MHIQGLPYQTYALQPHTIPQSYRLNSDRNLDALSFLSAASRKILLMVHREGNKVALKYDWLPAFRYALE